ncbi:MAG: SIS domain-containing protein [Microcoleus sp.]
MTETNSPNKEAIDLTSDTTALTAISNDLGFEQVFARQLLAKAREGDAIIGLSTSGNSKNVLAAFAHAKKMGMVMIVDRQKKGEEKYETR